jgi:hypothetical protein
MKPKPDKVIQLVNPIELVVLPHMLRFEDSIIHLN